MYLLDAMDSIKEHPRGPFSESEFEVFARVHLTGLLDLGAVNARCWELPEREGDSAVRSVYLSAKLYWDPNPTEPLPPPPSGQYYFPGGLVSEVVVLLSLFTRAHFTLARTLKQTNVPIMTRHRMEHDVGRSPVDGKTFALGDIERHFRKLEALRQRELGSKVRRIEPFMLAARLYQLSISVGRRDEGLAYINLVSAIEALLHDFEISSVGLEDVDPGLADMIRKDCAAAYGRIEKRILSRERFLKRRFTSFILTHLTEDYWNCSARPQEMWQRFKDPSHIEDYLKRIYDTRSSTLHEGAVFPPGFTVAGQPNEVPIGMGMSIGKKSWGEKELLPPLGAFEHVVHHVLLEYLRREADAGLSASVPS